MNNMDFEEQLINLVKERKCLYHTKSRSIKNNEERTAVWRDISKKLGRSHDDCKQRWRSLRDRFVREKKKMEQLSENSSADVDRWEFYDSLMFLIPSVKRRKNPLERTSVTNDSYDVDVTSQFASEHFSYEENFESNPSTPISYTVEVEDLKEDFIVPDNYSYDETFESTQWKRKKSEAAEDSKEGLIDLVGAINTKRFMSNTGENKAIIEAFQSVSSTQKISSSKSSVVHSNERHLFYETPQSVPSTSKSRGFAASINDSKEALVDLVEILKTAVNSRPVEEKDENDLFLECIGKKMKRLPEAAKLRIQAKLLADVTLELLSN